MTDAIVEDQPTSTPPREAAPQPTTQMFIGCLVIPVLLVLVLGGVLFRTWQNAATNLTVPDANVLLVYSAPDEAAPLIARFGAGHVFEVLGRSDDWRWLEVETWDGQSGWTLRPLDILVWQIQADPSVPQENSGVVLRPDPVEEEMVSIDGGTFTMGSPPGLGDEDESPAHAVTLSPYAIDRTEVTVGQYWSCVQAHACLTPTEDRSQTQPHYINDPAFDNHPVINVPWSEAKAYCTWRGKRLPTEAEWEMAAGWDATSGAKARWPWGNEGEVEEANLNARRSDTTTVGSYMDDSSPAGVLDMGGNVREWVLDWYKVDYYSVADDTDPTGPSNRRGEGSGRVVRGGYFASQLFQARTAARDHADPAYGYPMIGFRCAQDR